ncbi:hypothetical protein N657DRAFT_562651 [Parathielavia appendiculata]|uniref:Uncharacterized protein n=1 Tax=Parathielavia appendiculata TaxID=2587402 RepID=A0AAN6Z9W8_9PEZI|nr:hypothetical protein N657DRAFT_562651 [Parathielavia appendiculata]
MASRRFLDPIVLLRAAPLVSSTCTLLYARDQDFFLGLLNRGTPREHSGRLLPAYFGAFFQRGVVFVVACIAATTWTSIGNLFVRRPALHAKQSFWWYAAGAVFSASHLLFVPLVAPPIQAIVNAEKYMYAGIDPNVLLDRWLSVNWIRMVTVDLAAWVACVVAATKSLKA